VIPFVIYFVLTFDDTLFVIALLAPMVVVPPPSAVISAATELLRAIQHPGFSVVKYTKPPFVTKLVYSVVSVDVSAVAYLRSQTC
jgi:hypothetical protein